MVKIKRFGAQTEDPIKRPDTMIFGIGGAGRNILSSMIDTPHLSNVDKFEVGCVDMLPNLPFIQIDKRDMKESFDSKSSFGIRPPNPTEEKLIRRIKNADILYLLSGMGGRTGSWTTPTLAHIGKNKGAFTIALLAMPFETENTGRCRFAEEAKDRVGEHADILGVFSNSRLLSLNPHLPMTKAFDVMNNIISLPVQDLNAVVTKDDLKTLKVFCDGVDEFRIGAGYGRGRERGKRASEEALRSPWLDDFSDYRTILSVVTSGVGSAELEASDALDIISEKAPKANILWGLRKNPELGERTKVTLLAGK